VPGRAGSSPDKAGTCQHCQMARVRRARRRGVREEPALLRPSNWSPARIWRMWAGCGAFLPGRLTAGIFGAGFTCWPRRPWGRSAAYLWRCRWGRAGLLLRRADSSEHGNHLTAVPGWGAASALAGIGAPAAEPVGRGGAAVVVRGRESRSHGEGRQRFYEGRRLQCRQMRR